MKKVLMILTMSIVAGLLTACQGATSPLVISKLYDATTQANNVIELYNTSDKDEDLSNYVINVYTNGATEVQKTIELSGTVAANSFFDITSSNATNADVIANSDFEYTEGSLPFNGNDAMQLVKKTTVIDSIGTVGSDVDYALDLTLIRLGEIADWQGEATYDTFNYIMYIPDAFQYLKNDDYGIKTLDDLYAGPQLEDRYKEMSYISETDSSLGGGGAVLTTNTSIADGDTAYFTSSNGFPGGSVRYFYINTPEVQSNYVNAEPWGYVASLYNKHYILSDADTKVIYVQSIPNYSLTEVNGRNLALVWVNGALSQFLTVSEGLSQDVDTLYNTYDYELTYLDVPYLTFLRFAENRAVENGWGTKGYPANPDGEKSPDWNYQANENSTSDPVWTPHLALPWE